MTGNSDKMLSLILLSYYSKERLPKAYERLTEVLGKEHIPFELIIVDDGSKDESYRIALGMEKKYENVFAYKLSRNYTSHYSAFAGLSVCNGACAVLIPDDEQLPYSTVVEAYRLWEQGHQVVIPHRQMRDEPWVKRNTSELFYNIMNAFSDVKFPPGGADSFFIDREVIDILNERIHPIRTTTITEILRLGFDPYFQPYMRPFGDNKKSRWSFKKKYNLAKDFFFSSSTFPIKLITYLGIGFALFAFLLVLAYAYGRLWGNDQFWHLDEVPGWVSTITIIGFFSGLTLFSLGIIAEYVWRIFEEVKARPGYIIRKKKQGKDD